MKKKSGLKKYQMAGQTMPNTTRGTVQKQTSPGGMYRTKVVRDDQGNIIKSTERRTVKGFLSGAPRAKGKITRMKSGGSTKKK